jgi:hypothetical protein
MNDDRFADWSLVHGEIVSPIGNGQPMGHAWLQHDGVTYDPVPDLMLPAADYIAKYKAAAITSYSPEEAALVGARSGHFGPWQVLRIKAELASASSLTRSRND